jgi:6-phosphogluconolactonase
MYREMQLLTVDTNPPAVRPEGQTGKGKAMRTQLRTHHGDREVHPQTAPSRRRQRWLALAVLAVSVPSFMSPALAAGDDDSDDDGPIGAVYVATNAGDGNEILTFTRAADGALTASGTGVDTEGLGSGPDPFPPLRDDPLGSQGSLVVDQENQLLFAANAGSDNVSVFAIDPDGLELVDTEPSNGDFPVGVAVRDDLAFVLNAKSNSISGYQVDHGELSYIDTCQLPDLPLGGDGLITQTPGQIGFSPDGDQLVVVSKEGLLLADFPTVTLGNGAIHIYDVDDAGVENCSNPTTTELPANADGGGKFPFSFTWSANGHLLLVEVFGSATSLAGSAVSSFDLDQDGTLTPVSTSVASGQGVACWIVRSGKHAFVTNFLSDSISSYKVKKNGTLKLKDDQAAVFGPGNTEEPIDLAVTDDGRYIYQLTPGSAMIRPYEVGEGGALTALTPVADGLAAHSGQAGIATVDFD